MGEFAATDILYPITGDGLHAERGGHVPDHRRDVPPAMGDREDGAARLKQKQDPATVIHLCGAGTGQEYPGAGSC